MRFLRLTGSWCGASRREISPKMSLSRVGLCALSFFAEIVFLLGAVLCVFAVGPASNSARARRAGTATASPPYAWVHEMRVEGHLALHYSPAGAFSPDGSSLAIVERRRVVLVNVASGSVEKAVQPSFRNVKNLDIQSANYISPDHLFILAAGKAKLKGRHGSVRTPELAFQWDIPRNALLGKVEAVGAKGGFEPPVYLPLAKILVLYKKGTYFLWNPLTGLTQSLTLTQLTHPAHLFAFSPDGRWLLLAQIEANASPNPVVVLLKQHAFVNVLPGHQGTVLSMTFSPGGKILQTSCEDGKVRLWSVPGWNLLAALKGNLGPVHWAEFSPDGQYIASAGEDDTVRIWQVATGKLIQTLEESKHPLLTVTFSPNGKYLAASSDRAVHVWVRTQE